MSRIRQLITQFLSRPGYKALKPKLLAKKIGVTKKKMAAFEAALEEARSSGDIRILESGRIVPRLAANTYSGILRKIASGDAFVILHEPRPAGVEGDLFVDAADCLDSQNGDEVLVRLRKRVTSQGHRCAEVVDIVQRATNVFVGTYFEEDDKAWVQIDGKNYGAPIWVGDPGAKGAIEGDKVVVEMLRFPSADVIGEGVLTKVLGPRGVPGVDTQLVIHEFAIPDEFPEIVLEEARLQAETYQENDLTDREDLTETLIVTIDPVDARDFDDAISLERWENGHWHLGVHIADVSHFVQPGTELDREAQLRGNSVYLPTKVIPMLPEIISNGLASLQAERVRFTVSAFIEFSPDGIPVSSRFARSAIRAKHRFAYEEVMPLVNNTAPDEAQKLSPEILTLLGNMHELAMLLRERRFAQTALELDMPEVKLDFDQDGKVIGAHETDHDESHQMIEEFMLAANVAVAQELDRRGLPFMRRVHPDPSLQKMTALGEFVEGLGFPMKQVQSRSDLQKLLKKVKGTPKEHAISYAVLRSLKQATYSPLADGHYALAEEHYCHFTSPIRRYPDLLIHRMLLGLLENKKNAFGQGMEEQLRMGRHCSTTERRAERAERELVKIKLLTYMESRIGEEMDAIITGVDRYGFFCRGVEIPAEGLVHIGTLSRSDYFDFDRPQMALVSKSGVMYQLGDRVRVEVISVDVNRRELNLKLAKGADEKRPAPKSSSSRKQRINSVRSTDQSSKGKRQKPRKKNSSRRKGK
ncbi:ribonuclease R [Planctomicrobium sp. SH668]|uniref:ribonuclease R n=1 Tax=Planctomicrobium sp. SH668 TaxID=3448126 RepID=UPI003F5C0F3E